MIQRIGLFTGLAWSGSFLLTMLSLTHPGWGLAGNILGAATIWVAGMQIRACQTQDGTLQQWGLHRRWRISLQVHLLAMLVCTFVQFLYFQFLDDGSMLGTLTAMYSDPEVVKALKQTFPDFNAAESIRLLRSMTISDFILQILIMNSMLAILLSIPTMFVSGVRKRETE